MEHLYDALAEYARESDLVARLVEEIPPELFAELGVPDYAIPKIHRRIPKKRAFQNFSLLRKHYIDRAILSLYTPLEVSLDRVGLFTWVMSDGYGDWMLQEALAQAIHKSFPQSELLLFTRLSKGRKPFTSPFPRKPLSHMANCDLILQAPTYYRSWKNLKTPVENLGEYGFIDSPRFHPQSGGRCLGLHFLEKGILIPDDLDMVPLPIVKNRYLAYLTTARGFVIFFAMLFTRATEDIEVIVPKLDHLFTHMEALKAFAASRGFAKFEIYFDDSCCPISIQDSGKIAKIFFKPHIEKREFMTLLKTSPIVGCRGNQSFIETLASGRPFFYDPVKHNLPFLHDLAYLVKDRLPDLYPLFSLFLEAQTEDVDTWLFLGTKLATEVREAFSLFSLLKKDYCFNPVLEGIIKRAAYIKRHPDHLAWEEGQESLPFPAYYAALKEKLDG